MTYDRIRHSRSQDREHPYDWERFWVHFVCGALFGAFFGFLFWFSNWTSALSLSAVRRCGVTRGRPAGGCFR